jgi:hypothetical protein
LRQIVFWIHQHDQHNIKPNVAQEKYFWAAAAGVVIVVVG